VDTGRWRDGTSTWVGLLAREPEEGGEGKPVRMEDTGGSSMERVRWSSASRSMQRLHPAAAAAAADNGDGRVGLTGPTTDAAIADGVVVGVVAVVAAAAEVSSSATRADKLLR